MVTHRISKFGVAILTLLITLGVALSLPLFSITVYAIDSPRVTLGQPASQSASYTASAINSEASRVNASMANWFTWNASDYTMSIDMSKYRKLSESDKHEVMEIALSTINNSGMSHRERVKLYNFVCEQDEATSSLVRQLSKDVNPDFAMGYSWFRPFTGTVSTILGFLSLVLFAMIGLVMILDLSYLTIPIFRAFVDKPNNTFPKGISREAGMAIKISEESAGTEYKAPLSIYFKLKVKQIMILGVCLLYLIGGKIYDLVAMIIDTLTGMVGN